MLLFPGMTAESGIVAVSCVELTKVEGTVSPLNVTVLFEVKLLPAIVPVNPVWIGPQTGLIEETVGAAGRTMLTETALEIDGVEVAVSTVMVAVPGFASNDEGTGAERLFEPSVIGNEWISVPSHDRAGVEAGTGDAQEGIGRTSHKLCWIDGGDYWSCGCCSNV